MHVYARAQQPALDSWAMNGQALEGSPGGRVSHTLMKGVSSIGICGQ